eukprot:1557265-Lingulodinium_polyedra.AAC.1
MGISAGGRPVGAGPREERATLGPEVPRRYEDFTGLRFRSPMGPTRGSGLIWPSRFTGSIS